MRIETPVEYESVSGTAVYHAVPLSLSVFDGCGSQALRHGRACLY
ncbi:hypothetical protein [Roseiflexus sp.]